MPKMPGEKPLVVDFKSYRKSVPALLDALAADKVLAQQARILVKPNLTNASPPPVTTPVECCEAVIAYIREHSNAEIIIGEGCGEPGYDTFFVFERLGYTSLSKRRRVSLVDLNQSPVSLLERDDCKLFPRMYLPTIALESYVISVPVLKAHSLADITGTLKNMMGLLPPAHYQCGGHWKKSAFHAHLHQAITELNRYVSPRLTLLDGRVGLAEHHLGGAECNPRVGKLIGGYQPLAVDRRAAELLGLDPAQVPHLAADPEERRNLFGTNKYRRVAGELSRELANWFQRYAVPALDGLQLPVTGQGQISRLDDDTPQKFFPGEEREVA